MFPLVDGIEFFVSEREKISFVRKWRLKAPLIRPGGGGGYACMHLWKIMKQISWWGEEILYGWVCRGQTSSAIFDPSLRPFL